jgi:branched-chain amino acid transport system permease protein
VILAVDAETLRQLTVDGFFRGCSYGLLGVGFALILGVTGRFHFAYGFTYTLAAYMAFTFTFRVDLPFWPGAVLGVLAAAAVGAAIERVVYRPLVANAGPNALLAVFVAALGLGIAGDNLIRLFWGSETQAYFGPTKKAYHVWDTVFLNFDVWQAVSGIVITILLALTLRYSALGRRIKATRVNPDLARTIGIDADATYVICFFLGTICAGVAAIWYALKFTIDPAMGSGPIIYAFVVAFLAGTARSPIRVFVTGIVVALIEQYSSIWLSVRWTQTAVFVVLVSYLTVLAVRSSAFIARFRRPTTRA